MKKLALVLLMGLTLAGCGKKDPNQIIPYGRENNSGTYTYFKEHVLKEADFASNVQTLPGTAAVINAVSKDPKSIGYGGIGYVKGVRILKVKKDANSPGVEPTQTNVVSGDYPISRYLYFYTVGEPSAQVKPFIDWVMSTEGQKICESVGYFPLIQDKQVKNPIAAKAGKTTITIKGSDTMVILGQRWAENYMKEHPSAVVQITGGGSGTGIAALINGATDICQASRPIKDNEKAQIKKKFGKDVIEYAVAMDGIAIFVNESNPLEEISLDQLKGIYTGSTKSWKAL